MVGVITAELRERRYSDCHVTKAVLMYSEIAEDGRVWLEDLQKLLGQAVVVTHVEAPELTGQYRIQFEPYVAPGMEELLAASEDVLTSYKSERMLGGPMQRLWKAVRAIRGGK